MALELGSPGTVVAIVSALTAPVRTLPAETFSLLSEPIVVTRTSGGVLEGIPGASGGWSATRRTRRVASFRLIAQSVPILRLRGLDGLLLNIARIVSAAALQRYHMVHDRSGNLIILGGIWEDHLGERPAFAAGGRRTNSAPNT